MKAFDGVRSPKRFYAYAVWILGFLLVSSYVVWKKQLKQAYAVELTK